MSESETHARLVGAMLDAIVREHQTDELVIRADISSSREHAPTILVGGLRPDLLVNARAAGTTIIGEAKTARDVDTLHTRAQLKAFLEHLCTERNGVLWVSVPLARAGEAQRVVRTVRRDVQCERVRLVVSGWLLGLNQALEARWNG